MKKWWPIVKRIPAALMIAYRMYRLCRKHSKEVAWRNAKGYFKLALAWKK